MTTVVPQLIVTRALFSLSLPDVAASHIVWRRGVGGCNGAGCMTGWGEECVTAHHQPCWFLWVSGLSCKQTLLPFLSLCPPSPPSMSQLLQLESSARVYFHGWGVKTALSLFWLPCLPQLKRWSVQGTGVGLRTPRGEGMEGVPV